MVMATALSVSSPWRHHHCFTFSSFERFNSDSLQFLCFPPKFHPHRPSLPIRLCSDSNTRSPRCQSAGPGPPSPPDSNTPSPPGFVGKLFVFQDQVWIFFAVLFWMSLFFWSPASDGGNSSRPDKGSRFIR
ncbi:uncharacterized protein LOC120208601 [Hibiscus syriacus]|uniref:uncharacterized protein LOC120208601 n=1 Tax=Hibiscus syriacus TaxID=106335 RepID=UPI0019205F07|nr:uncharacterized protein LOC120208601 [Hibiscus syriacus]